LGNLVSFTIAGWTESNDGDVSGKHGSQDLDVSRDAWIFAINATGSHEVLWQKCYGGTDDDEAKSIILSPDGTSLVVAGYSASNDGDLQSLITYAGDNAWIFAIDLLDAAHPLTDNRVYGGNSLEDVLYIQPAPDGGYIATGFTESADGDIPSHYGSVGSKDILLLKLNNDLSKQWIKIYGGRMDDVGAAVGVVPDQQAYYVLGSTSSDDYDVADLNKGDDAGTSDIALLKLDYSGNLLNIGCIGGSKDDFGVRFGDKPTFVKGVLLGTTLSNDGDFAGLNNGGDRGTSDIVIIGV
jgi:hypothetical protein